MINKIKKVSVRDILGIIKFLIVLIPSLLYKIYLKIIKKEIWLICETEKTARDNGVVFFEYMKNIHPEIICYYAIDKKSSDFKKIEKYSNIIQWGTIKHYFYYMSCTKNVSSHKQGNPNQTLFTILHLYLNLYNNRYFLQHGILYQNLEMFHQKNCRFKMFVCGAKDEYDFIKEKYGYRNNEVCYTGLARFDNLHNKECDSKIILYMPTWRRWLSEPKELEKSNYYKKISALINSKELEDILERNDKELWFCPHDGLRKGKDLFITSNKRVKVIDISTVDIQQLLIKGSMLITDFSSLHSDFAYMKKPIIYYQYDKEEFMKKHIGKYAKDTYFDYEKDGFGKVVSNEVELLEEIENILTNKSDNRFIKKTEDFFKLNDTNNCERIYSEIARR